jgi:hypothetical protein
MERQRGEIWQLLTKAQVQKSQYSQGVYPKFLAEDHPQMDYKISKDVHRTVPGKILF